MTNEETWSTSHFGQHTLACYPKKFKAWKGQTVLRVSFSFGSDCWASQQYSTWYIVRKVTYFQVLRLRRYLIFHRFETHSAWSLHTEGWTRTRIMTFSSTTTSRQPKVFKTRIQQSKVPWDTKLNSMACQKKKKNIATVFDKSALKWDKWSNRTMWGRGVWKSSRSKSSPIEIFDFFVRKNRKPLQGFSSKFRAACLRVIPKVSSRLLDSVTQHTYTHVQYFLSGFRWISLVYGGSEFLKEAPPSDCYCEPTTTEYQVGGSGTENRDLLMFYKLGSTSFSHFIWVIKFLRDENGAWSRHIQHELTYLTLSILVVNYVVIWRHSARSSHALLLQNQRVELVTFQKLRNGATAQHF